MIMNDAVTYPLTVYYERSCPLCASEMHALKALDAQGRFALVDCSAADFDAGPVRAAGIEPAQLMQIIHAQDADGRWLRGVDVFVQVYAAADLAPMVRLWSHPRLRPVFDRIYPIIARYRHWLTALGAQHFMHWLMQRLLRQRAKAMVAQSCANAACERRD